MARRRHRKDQRDVSTPSLTTPDRLLIDHFVIEAPLRLPISPLLPSPREDIRRDPFAELRDIEDRREFDFDSEPGFMTTEASIAEVQEVPSPIRKGVINDSTRLDRGVMAFRDPHKVAVCVRRHERREVLHALRRVGRGSGKKRRRNEASDIKC